MNLPKILIEIAARVLIIALITMGYWAMDFVMESVPPLAYALIPIFFIVALVGSVLAIWPVAFYSDMVMEWQDERRRRHA